MGKPSSSFRADVNSRDHRRRRNGGAGAKMQAIETT
jgi:hypothetical protein